MIQYLCKGVESFGFPPTNYISFFTAWNLVHCSNHVCVLENKLQKRNSQIGKIIQSKQEDKLTLSTSYRLGPIFGEPRIAIISFPFRFGGTSKGNNFLVVPDPNITFFG